MTEQNCYGDGTVFEGVRSKDSVVSTLELPVRSFVRLSEEEIKQILTEQEAALGIQWFVSFTRDIEDALAEKNRG